MLNENSRALTNTTYSSGKRANSLSIIDNRTGLAYDIPIENNSIRALDFKNIKAAADEQNPAAQTENGIRIFDHGFQNTACMHSEITFVDGNAGQISYRGHSVGELSRTKAYEEVAFLLIYGHLPTADEHVNFNKSIAATPLPPQSTFDMIENLPLNCHLPTAIGTVLLGYVAACPEKIPAHCCKNLYKGNLTAVDREIPQWLFTYSVIACAIFCRFKGRKFTPPRKDYSYIENILLMMGFVDPQTGEPEARVKKILNRMFIFIANHELTNSTAAFLHAASTLTDPYSCSVSSMMAGLGILHGGAMEAAYKQLESVGDISNVPQIIADVKSKKMRLFGYGHRMYKVTDPRSILVRELIEENMDLLCKDKVLAIAYEIDRIASQDEYFISRKLCSNPDLFMSFVYKALGIPCDFVIAMAFMGRNPGFISHWREAMSDPQPRMWRPLQIYTGALPAREANGEER